MIKNDNPYYPGAGSMPRYLAGREQEMKDACSKLDLLRSGLSQRSIIYYGLRGVGKTVLLNKIEEYAQQQGVFYSHIEAAEQLNFVSMIITAANKFLRMLSPQPELKHIIGMAMDAVKSLAVSFTQDAIKFEISQADRDLYVSGSLEQSLTDLFTALGNAAQKSGKPICFFVDEIQFMKTSDLSALIAAIHRTNQLGYPVMMIGAGLPKIFKLLGDAQTYAERLIEYHEIGSLTDEQAEDAIRIPAKQAGKWYDPAAEKEIIRMTGAYPYFIQELCYILWNDSEEPVISEKAVKDTEKEYIETLDSGFYLVRFQRTTDREKQFMYAMVDCGSLPCTIGNVAANMGKHVNQVSPIRAQLISKGLIYAAGYGQLDFTVPKFDDFLKRKRAQQEETEKQS